MKTTDSIDPSNWPPKSPYEAILSSPNGRRKLRGRETPIRDSASPIKRPNKMPDDLANGDGGESMTSDEDEDEETLQLKLAAIEAKLKLKKLKGKKAIAQAEIPSGDGKIRPSAPLSRSVSVLSSRRDKGSASSHSTTGVQVPLSPTKLATPCETSLQRSPSRVLLGIDKGLNGKNVSLKRAPSQREQPRGLSDPFQDARVVHSRTKTGLAQDQVVARRTLGTARSFSAKMSETRDKEAKEQRQRDRTAKLREARSSAFAVDQEELGALKKAAREGPQVNDADGTLPTSQTFSRNEVLRGVCGADKSSVQTAPKSGSSGGPIVSRRLSRSGSHREQPGSSLPTQLSEESGEAGRAVWSPGPEEADAIHTSDASLFEPYAAVNLSRRVLPHTFVQRTLEGKRSALIPQLLKTIKAPEYIVPDELIESDFVLFALVASKSEPIDHKKTMRTETKGEMLTSGAEAENSMKNENGKYMVLKLTDLKWTLDLFLFGPAFVRFRKLTPGTLIAILNPDIMPPPKHLSNTGRWSLKLASAEETVLEIGTSKDLGWCKSVKKDGQPCGDWVDRRHTEFCEFHMNLGVEKLRSGRMEVQGMSSPFGPGGRQGSLNSRRGGSGTGTGRGGRAGGERDSKKRSGGLKYDRGVSSTYYIAPNQGLNQSAASLFDADDFNIRGGSEARQREILAAREKEFSIAESLGMKGNGAGADYLRVRRPDKDMEPRSEATSTAGKLEKCNAKSLGLAGNKSTSILLSPLKRKRSVAGDDTLTSTKKKTRFVTSKGIREAGRDSLNIYDSSSKKAAVSDDELDIV